MKARLARALLRLFSALPFRIAQSGGALLGWLHWPFPNRTRQASADNLARCYPQLETRARRRLVRDSLVEMGRTFAESAWLWRRSGPQVMALVREVRGQECLVEARRAGRGVQLATPHIGSWELAGAACGQEEPLTVMFRPPRLEGLGHVLLAARTRLGMQPVPTDAGGIRALHRALQNGDGVGLLPDQRPQAGHGVEAPFFGQSVPTMTLLSRFARRHDAPVIMVVMERLPRGQGFRLHYWRAEEAVADPELTVAAAAVNREVERAIALAPAQYMWSYRRFRRRK
jgi:KDO2-lipid IV(A) lauroyltransferase